MQLSILIATNRTGLLVCSRIAQACSWATPDIEVVVRDNSGDPQKREFLALCRRENCNIMVAEPCDVLTNFTAVLGAARGDFVFLLADDDFCFDHAIPAAANLIRQFGEDPTVAGVTGAYVVEMSQGSSILSYQNIESSDALARVTGFLRYVGPNIMHYAPIRRDVVQRVYGLLSAMPAIFSFHDQVICLLYLLNGKFVRLARLLYLYDVGVWEKRESGQERDIDFYVKGGFDPAINALHWFICGFEGAVLVRNARVFPELPLSQRQAITDLWFSLMFNRFKNDVRTTLDSRFAGQAGKVREKLLQSTGRLLFPDMLKELRDFIALFSEDRAQSYYGFWDSVINNGGPAARGAEALPAVQAS